MMIIYGHSNYRMQRLWRLALSLHHYTFVIYHVIPLCFQLEEVAHFTFMCGQNAVFSQDSLTCAHPTESLPCSEAAAHYEASNANFGIIPEENQEFIEQPVSLQ